MGDLLELTDAGFYCAAGGFHIDPWRPVERAIITHAHGDHARPGSETYVCTREAEETMRLRLGDEAQIETLEYRATRTFGDATVALHPAGHILGSAQVRVEAGGEVWVLSGDYKAAPDPTCAPFEPLRCDVFISECTFGLPIYRWPDERDVFAEIHEWWRDNLEHGRTSIIFAYTLGKAQRILAGLTKNGTGSSSENGTGSFSGAPILLHGAVRRMVEVYERAGVRLPQWHYADESLSKEHRGRALVIAPPSAARSPWLRRFGDVSTAFVSGWMQIRGARRRRSVDRGFVLSDHADWPGLLSAIEATGASRIGLTHGATEAMARYLTERGYDTITYRTRFEGEIDDVDDASDADS